MNVRATWPVASCHFYNIRGNMARLDPAQPGWMRHVSATAMFGGTATAAPPLLGMSLAGGMAAVDGDQQQQILQVT